VRVSGEEEKRAFNLYSVIKSFLRILKMEKPIQGPFDFPMRFNKDDPRLGDIIKQGSLFERLHRDSTTFVCTASEAVAPFRCIPTFSLRVFLARAL
jgi:hypothetical protein